MASDSLSASDRLLAMADEFASQGRPAMAEAARRAAVAPAPPIEWRPAEPRGEPGDAASSGFRWTA